MQTLQQKVYIPQNHQLNFSVDVPVNIPIGNTEIMLVFNTKISSEKQQRTLGLYEDKGSFKINDDFKMSDDEMLSL